MNFSSQIINWYKENKRDLPWRETGDPYKIWLSEIILQQTRVEQGLSYYLDFVNSFPTIQSLAKATEDRIMKKWQGLGYYSRARNMYYTAKVIVNEYNGVFPDDFSLLKKLKGIGDYTAAAIASFAFNKPNAVVDGNVVRVISRIFGIKQSVDIPGTKNKIYKIVSKLITNKEPGLFNQAIMEFGELQCVPRNPKCEDCCMNHFCFAFAKNMVDKLPLKKKKNSIKNRYLNYIIVNFIKNYRNYIYVRKRTEADIWKNLYDFPSIETKANLNQEEILSSSEWNTFFRNTEPVVKGISAVFKHQLTHQTLYVRFYEVMIKSPLQNTPLNVRMILKNEIKKLAIPRVIDKYIETKPFCLTE
jgi:A/G-specific adenine glycosylase